MSKTILQENEKYIKELPREFLLYQPYIKIQDFLMQALVIEQKEDKNIRGISYKVLKKVDLNRYRLFNKDTVYIDIRNLIEKNYYCDIIKNIEIVYPKDYNNFKMIIDKGDDMEEEISQQDIMYSPLRWLNFKLKFENSKSIDSIDIIFTIYLLDCELRKEIASNI